jgi:hypothetical protein
VLVIRRRGGGNDVEPTLVCTVCRQALHMQEAWLAFTPVTEDEPQSAGVWVHKACVSGRAMSRFHTPRLVLWRGVDFLSRLLRATEIPERPGHRDGRRG